MFANPSPPETNGLVERFNKTLATVISAYVDVNHEGWEDKVHLVAFAIKITRQASTRFTPLELVYGRPPCPPD